LREHQRIDGIGRKGGGEEMAKCSISRGNLRLEKDLKGEKYRLSASMGENGRAKDGIKEESFSKLQKIPKH